MTFCLRANLDVLAEVSLLAIKFYAEAGAFERAKEIANDTKAVLALWRGAFQAKFGSIDREHFRLSHLTFRYQLASLYSWSAFLAHQSHTDLETRLRLSAMRFMSAGESSSSSSADAPSNETSEQEQPSVSSINNKRFKEIRQHIREAGTLMKLHRLAFYSRALICQRADAYGEVPVLVNAKTQLLEILHLISPYDPFGYVDRWEPRYDVIRRTSKPHTLKKLDIAKRVSGAQQFDTFLNESTLHRSLADVTESLGESQPSIEHLRSAIVWSSHLDVEAEIFLRLTRQLTTLERFEEAQAIIDAMRLPPFELTTKSLSIHKRGEPSRSRVHRTYTARQTRSLL